MNGDFIRRARNEIIELRRRRAAEKRRDKLEQLEDKTELELYLDDCAAENLDPKNPEHWPVIIRGWCLKNGVTVDDNVPDWDTTENRLDF